MKKEYVVVGGGPTGLMLAIFLKKKFGNKANVTILEKRTTYNRKQILLLNKHTLSVLPKVVKENLLSKKGCYILAPAQDSQAKCYKNSLPMGSVPTLTLERELARHIRKNKLATIINNVAQINVVENSNIVSFKKPKWKKSKTIQYDKLFGADGAASKIRKDVLKSDFDVKFSNLYGATVNNTITTKRRKKSNFPEKADTKTKKRVQSNKPQHHSRFFRNRTRGYYIGLTLSESEYDKLKQAKNQGQTVPKFFQNRIDKVCTETNTDCRVEENFENTTIFPIEVGKSKKLFNDDNSIILVGDASATTHFFTGIGVNNAIFQAQKAVQNLNKKDFKNIYQKVTEDLVQEVNKRVTGIIDYIS